MKPEADEIETWRLSVSTPVGAQAMRLVLSRTEQTWTGTASTAEESIEVTNISRREGHLQWSQQLTRPLRLTLRFDVQISGDQLTGVATAGPLLKSAVSGTKIWP